jgi:hypothetical protein
MNAVDFVSVEQEYALDHQQVKSVANRIDSRIPSLTEETLADSKEQICCPMAKSASQ